MNDWYEMQYGGEQLGWWRTLIIESNYGRACELLARFQRTPPTGHTFRLVHILGEIEK